MIRDILVSDDLLDQEFMCNLDACKGACCWEGDYGAPLSEEEIQTITNDYEAIAPFLTEKGKSLINEKGLAVFYPEPKFTGTPLQESGACAFMTWENGIAQCGIEQAYKAKKTTLKKPISCHLYPIRITEEKELGFSAMNYDKWDICEKACEKGKKHQIPVYQFAKEAIIRRYGVEFYEELDAAANHTKESRYS